MKQISTKIGVSLMFVACLFGGIKATESVSDDAEKTTHIVVDDTDPFAPVLTGAAIAVENYVEEPESPEEQKAEYFDVPLEEDFQQFIIDLCGEDISPALVISIIESESRYNAKAIGDGSKSKGLMQIQERWHKGRMEKLGCTDLLDAFQNVEVGIDILKELYTGDRSTEWVLMAYNGGCSYANKMTKAGKVSKYAKTIIARAEELEGERTNGEI